MEKKDLKVLFVSEFQPINWAMGKVIGDLFQIGEACGIDEAEDRIFARNYTHVVVMGEFRSDSSDDKGRKVYDLLKLRLPIWKKSAKLLRSGYSNIDDPDYIRLPFLIQDFSKFISSH